MKTENIAESHQTDIPYTFPAGHETSGRGIMRLPENVKISEKVPSEKRQGASSDNTSILSDHTLFRI